MGANNTTATPAVCKIPAPKRPSGVITDEYTAGDNVCEEACSLRQYQHRRGGCLGFRSKGLGVARATPSLEACCLAWDLTEQERENASEERLMQFQCEFAKMVDFFDAEVLAHDATTGVIFGRPLQDDEMTAADTLVRLGQLLVRWAVAQSPQFGVRVGVATGSIDYIDVGGDRRLYFGPGCTVARRLAEGPEAVVNMSGSIMDQLSALRPLRFTISPVEKEAYILDPATEVLPRNQGREYDEHELGVLLIEDLPQAGTPEERMQKMTIEKFSALLRAHRVPVTKFGYGNAKTLREFYHAVVRDEKSTLISKDGNLERVVELVRIRLRAREGSRKMELRIGSQQRGLWSTRVRNQPLAMVLHTSEQGKWEEAVDKCFEVKFGLDARARKNCITMDRDAYSYSEVRSKSDTIPGIMTTYRTHSTVVVVKDIKMQELQKIGLPDFRDFTTTSASGIHNWTWATVTDDQEEELISLLNKGGVDVSEYTWQNFAELCAEIYEKKQASIELHENAAVRVINIIRVQLHADLFNLDHILVVKSKEQRGKKDSTNRMISMRMCVGQDWEDAVGDVLQLRLGIAKKDQGSLVYVDPSSHRIVDEIGYSRSYPGLKSLYVVTEVCVRVLNMYDRHWQFMGLPGGTDFTIVRMEAVARTEEKEVVTTDWGWQLCDETFDRNAAKLARAVTATPSINDHRAYDHSRSDGSKDSLPDASGQPSMSLSRKRRVAAPETLKVKSSDELLLGTLLQGRQTDWLRAHRAAARILDETYTTQDFYEDVVEAFPELRLYCLSRSTKNGDLTAMDGTATTSGNRTSDDEFQRTIGALFVIFWMMRLHLDGKECFCLGMDSDWKPKAVPESEDDASPEMKKRLGYLKATDWSALGNLMIGAGLLTKHGGPHDEDRMLTMLVLMAIHDIMKIDVLLPTVSMGMTEFMGYKSGEVISDHDIALSYVLETCPHVLPSFAGLSKAQQHSIKFSHCKLSYNMGWLVQAEAPPGALFKAFRNVIIEGDASPFDIAFYFVHWFADLAGAEPSPMQGSEKFVLKFPQKVLGSFIDSFPVVWTLSPTRTETQVLEDYLVWRWTNHSPSLGPPPTGPGSIAMLRLVLMAQGDSAEVTRQFTLLPDTDRHVLGEEMAMTGLQGQYFTRDSLVKTKYDRKGPAILVYYSPALMQKSGRKEPRNALMVLAEVFRMSRELWPLSGDNENLDRTITVRIDALKDLQISEMWQPKQGDVFVIHKKSTVDGMVEKVPTAGLSKLDWTEYQVLTFSDQKNRSRRNVLGNFTKMLSKSRSNQQLAEST